MQARSHPADQCLLVFCTCPDTASAEQIARALVEGRHAACVNVLPGVQSVYRWQGKVESARESVLLIKTTTESYPALERAVRDAHRYELPELIAVPIHTGLEPYLHWVCESVKQDQ